MNGNATAPAGQRKPRPKPARRISLRIKPEGTSPGVVRIAVGREPADYFVTAIPADLGRGFRVEKIGLDCRESAYAVNVNGAETRCECKGFLRHGHCKHADGIAALIAAGRL